MIEPKRRSTGRRSFIKRAVAGSAMVAGMPELLSATVSGQSESIMQRSRDRRVSPRDRIGLARIGAGGMGVADLSTALRIPGVELVAVCDVFDGRL